MIDKDMTKEQISRLEEQDDFFGRVQDATKKKKLVKKTIVPDIERKEQEYQQRMKKKSESKVPNKVNKNFQSSITDLKTKKPLDEFNNQVNRMSEKNKNSVRKIFPK